MNNLIYRTGLIILLVVTCLITGAAHSAEVKSDQPGTETKAAKKKLVDPFDDIEVPPVQYDLSLLPFPTRRMRELIMEAALAGDIEKLRPLIGVGDSATVVSLGGFDGDVIEFLKTQSGDDEGHEILAILTEVLEAGYVHLDAGTDRELFVWPYFFAWPLDKLSDSQKVELYRIVTYGDYLEMKDFGGYIFYRVGITPTGRWQFFVAGD